MSVSVLAGSILGAALAEMVALKKLGEVKRRPADLFPNLQISREAAIKRDRSTKTISPIPITHIYLYEKERKRKKGKKIERKRRER